MESVILGGDCVEKLPVRIEEKTVLRDADDDDALCARRCTRMAGFFGVSPVSWYNVELSCEKVTQF